MPQCKTCKAEIIWIKTQAGKHHPVDAKPKKMWVQDPMSTEHHGMRLEDCYESHFSTCAQADLHRRKKCVDFDEVNARLQIEADKDKEDNLTDNN